MTTMRLTALAALIAAPLSPALAQESPQRGLGAHVHGVGQLDMAIEGGRIEMQLRAPGADIVGFEHQARSDEDRASLARALAQLEDPLALFVLPEAAGCTVALARAELEAEDPEDHHEDHADDHDHDHGDDHDHAEEDGHDHGDAHGHDDDHDHDHADEDAQDQDADHDHADDHGHDEDHADPVQDGADHDHDHDHADDVAETGHSELHADYAFDCAAPSELTQITFGYFETFPNARALALQLLSDQGAQAFEITREVPVLDLAGRL